MQTSHGDVGALLLVPRHRQVFHRHGDRIAAKLHPQFPSHQARPRGDRHIVAQGVGAVARIHDLPCMAGEGFRQPSFAGIVPLVTLRADKSRLARPQAQTQSSNMTPEEREDLEDIEASVKQIATLVRTADVDAGLSAENAARIADIAAQTLSLVADLLAEAEDDDLAEERVETLRDLLQIATTSDATARRIMADRSLN